MDSVTLAAILFAIIAAWIAHYIATHWGPLAG